MSIPKPETGLAHLVQALGIIAWILLGASQLTYWATPTERETFLDRRWDAGIHNAQLSQEQATALVLLKIVAGLCVAGFLINLLEHLGRGTHYNRSLILVGTAAVLLLLLHHH